EGGAHAETQFLFGVDGVGARTVGHHGRAVVFALLAVFLRALRVRVELAIFDAGDGLAGAEPADEQPKADEPAPRLRVSHQNLPAMLAAAVPGPIAGASATRSESPLRPVR